MHKVAPEEIFLFQLSTDKKKKSVNHHTVTAKNSLITIRYNQISSKLRKLRSDEVHMYYVQYKDLGF